MVEAEWFDVTYIETDDRNTISIEIECPKCYGRLTADGDFHHIHDRVKFKPILQCHWCCYDFQPEGGLVPARKNGKSRQAFIWLNIATNQEKTRLNRDIRACYYEEANRLDHLPDNMISSGSNNGKAHKEKKKWSPLDKYSEGA
jgi:hypothetical protein